MNHKRYSSEYQSKLITAETAAGLVESGMSIHLGGAANITAVIDKHLARRKDQLDNVIVRSYIDTHPFEILKADPKGEVFKWYSGFVLPYTRPFANQRGCGIYPPASWHLVPDFVRSQYAFDILYFVTSPMNEAGHFNFGLTVADTLSVAEVAKKIVVVVREDMPCTFGGQEEGIHISRVDHIVEDREFKTFCLPDVPLKKEDRMIAENILSAGLIQDGTTLQVGIGGLPNAILDALPDAGVKHCGLHTEMVTENMVDLIEKGVVDNSRKKQDRYKSVCTFALGSQKLYQFLDKNPAFAFYPVDYVNHPGVIARQPKMLSLNSARQIDLSGQVASEQTCMVNGDRVCGLRPRQISGTGGQLDFVLGTMLTQDGAGVSILALYSQHNNQSRIVPMLGEGTAVTVPRTIVDYVATEWSLAKLKGLAIDERVMALTRIAHPAHRDRLMRQAADIGFLPYGSAFMNANLPRGVINCRN